MSERMCVETGCPVMIHGGSAERCVEHTYARLALAEGLLRVAVDGGMTDWSEMPNEPICGFCGYTVDDCNHDVRDADCETATPCRGIEARAFLSASVAPARPTACEEHGAAGCAFPGCGAANLSQSSTPGKEDGGSLVSEAPASPVAHPSWCGKPSTMAPSEIVWCKEHEPVATCRGTGRVLDSGFGDHVARLAQESGRDISIRPENFTKPCPGCTDCRGPTSGAADPVAPLPHHDASDHAAWANLCAHPECVAKVAGPVAPSTGGRAHKLRLKFFEMRDAREVTSAAGFELTTEAKAKLYDIQQDIVRAAIAADDRDLDPPPPSGGTSAGRCRGTGWTQQGSISCPGCPDCRPTTCRHSNVDCPGPAFCTAAACRGPTLLSRVSRHRPPTPPPRSSRHASPGEATVSGDVFIVWRVDFDSMENREPISREIVGYASTPSEAGDAARALFDTAPKYSGYEGGWGGEKTTYPKFEAQKVSPLARPPVTTP